MRNDDLHISKYIIMCRDSEILAARAPSFTTAMLDKKLQIRDDKIMDPKLNAIDPKLRETYEKVMGTATPTPEVTTAPPSQTPVTPTPMDSPPPPQVNTIPSGVPDNVTSGSTQPDYQKDNLQFQASIQSPFGSSFSPSDQTDQANTEPQPPSPMLKYLYIGGAILFFIAYTFFWIKVFNLPTPF